MVNERRSGMPHLTMVMLTIAGGLIVLMAMSQFADIIAPLMLTANLFIAAYPIQTWLVDHGIPRVVGQVALGATVLAILALFFWSLTWSVTSLVQELPGYQNEFWSLYNGMVEAFQRFGVTERQLLDQMQQINPVNFAGLLQGLIGQVTNFLTIIVILVTMVFMMAIDAGTFARRNGALRRYQPRVWLSIADFILGVRRYWVVSTTFGLIVAAIDVFALMLLDVPLAAVWGILAFLTNYIPNVGFIIGVVPPTLMALLANDPINALLVLVVYSVVNFVIQGIIQPKFNGDAVGVTATVAFLSLMLWSSVLGALGALLALPMTQLAKALLIDHDPQMRWLNAFLSNDPASSAPQREPEAPEEPVMAASREVEQTLPFEEPMVPPPPEGKQDAP